jgi:cell division protein FtsZ
MNNDKHRDSINMELVSGEAANIKVIGVGGAGGNAVNRMIQAELEGVEFISVNTDQLALENSLADTKILIGKDITKGQGAGADPDVAQDAILENRDEIEDVLKGANLVFIAAGMGKGTGTGASHVVAQICQDLGILTIAVVTKPFIWEGPARARNANHGLTMISKTSDTYIVIPNNKIMEISTEKTTFNQAYELCDEVLLSSVRSITNIVRRHGTMNIDFADITTVIRGGGKALMGTGVSEGENRAMVAIEKAINSPLLENMKVEGAGAMLVHFHFGNDFTMAENNDAMEFLYRNLGEENNTNIIFGMTESDDMNGKIAVTIIATGFQQAPQNEDNRFGRGAAVTRTRASRQAVEEKKTLSLKTNASVSTPTQSTSEEVSQPTIQFHQQVKRPNPYRQQASQTIFNDENSELPNSKNLSRRSGYNTSSQNQVDDLPSTTTQKLEAIRKDRGMGKVSYDEDFDNPSFMQGSRF